MPRTIPFASLPPTGKQKKKRQFRSATQTALSPLAARHHNPIFYVRREGNSHDNNSLPSSPRLPDDPLPPRPLIHPSLHYACRLSTGKYRYNKDGQRSKRQPKNVERVYVVAAASEQDAIAVCRVLYPGLYLVASVCLDGEAPNQDSKSPSLTATPVVPPVTMKHVPHIPDWQAFFNGKVGT
jgi:hypothetical protein